MNEEKKESNEIEINESESNEKTRSARDPRKGQAIQDASEWERKIKEAMIKAEEDKKQKA